MKRLLLLMLGLALTAPLSFGQQYVILKTDTFAAATTSGSGATVRTIGTSMTFARISWNVSGGTLAACSVKVQTSANGTVWVDLSGSTATCTSNGTGAYLATTPNYIRVSLATKSATAVLTTTLVGWMALPVSTITGSGAPSNPCPSDGVFYQNTLTGDLYLCEGVTWTLISFGGGGAISGSGANGRSTFWTGAATLSSDSHYLWDNTLKRLSLAAGGSLLMADMTQGSILFAGAGGLLTQDNPNLFWDATNKRVGIGTAAPNVSIDVTQDSAAIDINPTGAAANGSYIQLRGAGEQTTVINNSHLDGSPIGLTIQLSASLVNAFNTTMTGLYTTASPYVEDGHTVTDLTAIHLTSPIPSGAGSISNNHGLLIDDQAVPGATNYAINTGLGKVKLGAVSGEVILDGATASKCTKFDSNKAVVSDAGPCITSGSLTQAGLGAPIQVGVVRAVSQVAAIGTTTIFTVGGSDAEFEAKFALNCDGTSAAATVNISLGWTDPSNTSQTQTLGSAIVCTALGASSYGNLSVAFNAKSATTITYATSIVNTPTYDIRGGLYQLTSN